MGATWNSIRDHLEASTRTPLALRRYRSAAATHAALATFDEPRFVIDFMRDSANDIESKDRILRVLLAMAQQGGSDAELAKAMLWLGLWRALSGIYTRTVTRLRTDPDELVSSVALAFEALVGRIVIDRAPHLTASLVMSTERDLLNALQHDRTERRWLGVEAPHDASRLVDAARWNGDEIDSALEFRDLTQALRRLVGGDDANLVLQSLALEQTHRDLAEREGVSRTAITKRVVRAVTKIRHAFGKELSPFRPEDCLGRVRATTDPHRDANGEDLSFVSLLERAHVPCGESPNALPPVKHLLVARSHNAPEALTEIYMPFDHPLANTHDLRSNAPTTTPASPRGAPPELSNAARTDAPNRASNVRDPRDAIHIFAKVGMVALIDEATGFERHRAAGELQRIAERLRAGDPRDAPIGYEDFASREDVFDSCVKVGVVALLDEATGLDREHSDDELQRVFSGGPTYEPLTWRHRLPTALFAEVARLLDLACLPDSPDEVFANITDDIVASRIEPEVVEILGSLVPTGQRRFMKAGRPELDEILALRLLSEHLHDVLACARSAATWGEFKQILDRLLPVLRPSHACDVDPSVQAHRPS